MGVSTVVPSRAHASQAWPGNVNWQSVTEIAITLRYCYVTQVST